jgi:hypothetical protein
MTFTKKRGEESQREYKLITQSLLWGVIQYFYYPFAVADIYHYFITQNPQESS